MTGESSDPPAPGVRTAQRDPKEGQVSLETPALSDQTERRVSWVCPGCLVTQEDKDQRVLRDFKDSQVPMERRVQGAQQESQAQEVKEGQRGHAVRGDPGVQLERQDQRVTQEVTAPLDLPVNGVCQGHRGQPDSQGQRDHLDQPEKMDCLDIQDREARLVSKARLDLQDLPVWSDPRAPQVRQDQWEIEATPDPQAHQVSRVCPALLERREPRETQAPLDLLAKMVLLA